MNYIILTSHGKFASGLKQMAEMVLGDLPECSILEFEDGMGIEIFQQKVECLFTELNLKNNNTVILCDLKNGTPFNVCAQRIISQNLDNNTQLFYGMNFPMLLSVIEWQSGDIPLDELPNVVMAVQNDQVGVFKVNNNTEEDENF